jgi:hypothetical protein
MQEDLLDLILQTEMCKVLMEQETQLLLVVRVQMALLVQMVELQQERLREVLVLLEE